MADPLDSGLPPPVFNPEAYPEYQEMKRRQMLADMVLGNMKQATQTPQNWDQMRVVPRRGWGSNVAALANALMARKGIQSSQAAEQAYAQKLFGGAPPAAGASQTPPPVSQGGGGQGPPGQPAASNPYAPVTQQDIVGTSVSGLPPAGVVPSLALMGHRDPIAAMETYRKQQKDVLAQQHSADVARLDNYIQSDHPAQYAASDRGFIQQWPQLAQSMGLNPYSDYNDQNVRRALGMLRNPLASSLGMPTKEIPEKVIPTIGPYGYRGQVNPVTGEEKGVQGRELPTYEGVDIYKGGTGETEKRFIQKGGYFPGMDVGSNLPRPGQPMNVPNIPTGGSARTAGPQNVNMGMGIPKEGDFHAAGYAQYMRGGLDKVREMEAQGYSLPPSARAIIIDVATAEEGGITMQVLRQELLKRGLGTQPRQAQEYMAGLMPIMQAAGHAMAGARLTAGQMRTNFESLIPVDQKNKPAMIQIDKNRDNYYRDLLGQAGPAIRSPLYQESLGADFDQMSGAGALPPDVAALVKKHAKPR